MKQEILDWYAERHLEAYKQIKIGINRFGLSKIQIEAAMEHCYNKIVNDGKKVPDSQISWYVRNVARGIDTSGTEDEYELIKKAKSENKRLESDLDKEIAVTKSMAATVFDLQYRLEFERKKARRISIVYYIITISALIQAGMWLL